MKYFVAFTFIIQFVPQFEAATSPDCSTLPDGLYEDREGCSEFYYECTAGVGTEIICTNSSTAIKYSTGTCEPRQDVLACRCTEKGHHYLAQSGSCIVKGTNKLTWKGGYLKCERKAKWYGGLTGLVGRLAHISFDEASAVAASLTQSNWSYIGLRTILEGDGKNFSNYYWFSDAHNLNAVKPVKFSTELSNVSTLELDRQYKNYMAQHGEQWISTGFHEGNFLCEFFYDSCEDHKCEVFETCVPDTYFTPRCVCPIGLSGPECSDPADMEQICPMVGGGYKYTPHAPNSCFKIEMTPLNFQAAIDTCKDKVATTSTMHGRLAYIPSQEVQDFIEGEMVAATLAVNQSWIGIRVLHLDHKDGTEDFVFTEDGLTAFKPMTYIAPNSGDINNDINQNELCIRINREWTVPGTWMDIFCDRLYSSVCEVFTRPIPPGACHSFPCQNGGSCNKVNETDYTCSCWGFYYGTHCELFCDTVFGDDSECSKACDYGIKYTSPANILDRSKSPPEQCVRQDYYVFSSCAKTSCQTHTSQEAADCLANGGLYTVSACYFLAHASSAVSWLDAWSLCRDQGAQLAIVPDTDKVLDAIYAFILDQAPDTPTWIGLKATTETDGSTFPKWMQTEVEAAGLAINNHDEQEGCIAIGHVARDATNDGKRQMTVPCDTPGAAKAICMKRTPYTNFAIDQGHKIKMTPPLHAQMSTERNAWMCGLACHQWVMCVAHAFKTATGECELYEAKEGMMQTISSGANSIRVYEIVTDPEWDLYYSTF